MVKSSSRIPQQQLLNPRTKMMKKQSKKTTTLRRQRSLSLSLSPSSTPPPSNSTDTSTPISISFLSTPSPRRLLSRSISDPVPYLSDSCSEDTASVSKRVRRMMMVNEDFCNLPNPNGKLPPPLPPRPSPEFLRRTVSDPSTLLQSDSTKNSHFSASNKVLYIVNCSCECGKNYKFLV